MHIVQAGDASYDLYEEERDNILKSLSRRAKVCGVYF